MKRRRILFCCFYFRAPIVISLCTLHTTLLNTSTLDAAWEERRGNCCEGCFVQGGGVNSNANKQNSGSKKLLWSFRNLEQMQDRQYECVDGYACDYMIGDYHYGHASDYGGRREGAAPKTIRCPTKLGIWRDCWDPASQATIPFVELRENRHERHRHKRPAKRSH